MNTQSFVAKCLSLDTDVQQSLLFDEKKIEETTLISCIIDYLKKHYKFNVCKWIPPDKHYPQYMLLGGDKGILAYVVFQYYSGSAFIEETLNMPLNDTIKMVTYAESRLDRPIFFIKIFNYENNMGVMFETSEQIKDRLWHEENSMANGFYIPDISTMGSFHNLKNIWDDLKKNNIKQY